MNAKQHAYIGVLAGAGYSVGKYLWKKRKDPNHKFPWGQLALNIGLGLAFARLPDWIEPATDPNHRKFFHSLATGGLVCYGMYGKHASKIEANLLDYIRSVGFTYLSHLAADATTPRSLPLIHPKIV